MEEYYFIKHEQINKGERAMIIMDIKVDNFYAFKNFHMNMSYPKKIVDSTIEEEFLEERPNFRYKKVNIIIAENQKCLIKPYKNYINKSIVLPTSKIILLTEMVYNYKIYENKLQFILPSDAEKLLSKSNLFDLMGSTLDITGDDFEPPNFDELDVNDVFVGELESLRDEKYVFLAPASVSVSQIEQSVWKEIADICKKYGFIVVENENKNYQQKIGDIEVFKSIDETYLIAKKASFIISARSGLSDLLAYTKSPMMVIYPNKWSLEKFTFSKMPFSRHIIEIVEDGKLIQIVEEMLCH